MARARNIKPGLFSNELLVELPAFDRLAFIGLWCLADREGRLEDRVKRIKIELFPCDDYDMDAGLERLAAAGFVSRYEVAGYSVIEIVNFQKHQSPHGSEKDSVLPDINGYLTVYERKRGVVIAGSQRKVLVNDPEFNVKESLAPVDPSLDNGLIPDCGILIPDSLIPDSESKALVASGEATGDSDSKPKPSGKPDGYTQDFEVFWKVYPKRHKSSPKDAAWRVWKARIREGIPAADLNQAATRYSAEQHREGKVGTTYVKLPATFLGPDAHWREYIGKAVDVVHADPTVVDGVKYPRQVPRNYQCGPEEFWGFDAFADHVYHHKTHHMDYTQKNPRGDAC